MTETLINEILELSTEEQAEHDARERVRNSPLLLLALPSPPAAFVNMPAFINMGAFVNTGTKVNG